MTVKLSDVQVGWRVSGYVFRCQVCRGRYIGRKDATFCGAVCKQKAHRRAKERSRFIRDKKPAHPILSTRAINIVLNRTGIRHIDDPDAARIAAERLSLPILEHWPNCGRTSMNEIAEWLRSHGLRLTAGAVRLNLDRLCPDIQEKDRAVFISSHLDAETIRAMDGVEERDLIDLALWVKDRGYMIRKRPGDVTNDDDLFIPA